MLISLHIQNYALINELHIEFNDGFSIITGETGAGKSILLGALSMILGQRADTNVLQDKAKKCIVEGTFDVSSYRLKDFFLENELDYDDQTIVRREINESGKSRAFINDTPVNLQKVKELGKSLVDIHSQHQSLVVGNNIFQLSVLDSLAGNSSLQDEYTKAFNDYREALEKYETLTREARQAKSDLDYYQFQLKQMNEARLVSGEQEELEEELRILANAEEIKSTLNRSNEILSGEEASLINNLKDIAGGLAKIESFLPSLAGISERLESSVIELKDISDEVAALQEKVEFDPGRAELVSERLDTIYSLQQKHQVSSVEHLIEIRNGLEQKVNDIDSAEIRTEEAGKYLNKCSEQLAGLSEKLSVARMSVTGKLEEWMIDQLRQLGMPNAVFKVVHRVLDDFTPYGKDRVNFLFSANLKTEPMELSKVASGGEISRVMLSLKSLIARSVSLPTIIFDEIDAGVSGEIADKMGRILKNMSENIQLVNITHLPQIAAKGDYHYLVYKTDGEDATQTRVRLLSEEEREVETARMLSGEGLTEAAMVNARELLKRN